MATWKLENNILYYFGTDGGDTFFFSIAGLQNLPTVDENTPTISGITVNDSEVTISNTNYIDTATQITINGEGFTFVLSSSAAANVKVTSPNTTVKVSDYDANYSVTAENFNG